MPKKYLAALPVGFKAKMWGVEFTAVNQLDMFGGAIIILQSKNQDIALLNGKNTNEATKTFIEWLEKQPEINGKLNREFKVKLKKRFGNRATETIKVYATSYTDAQSKANYKINNSDYYSNYSVVDITESGKNLNDVLKKDVEKLIKNLNDELKDFNKGKNTIKNVKEKIVIDAPKIAKSKKAKTKRKKPTPVMPTTKKKNKGGRKPSEIHQTGTSTLKYDEMKKAKLPGKRTSNTGNVYYEYRKNRSDMPNSLTGVKRKVSIGSVPTFSDPDAAREIEIFALNDAKLYEQSRIPIMRMLKKKLDKGTYKVEAGAKAWLQLVNRALVRYNQVYGTPRTKWSSLLSVHDRKLLALKWAKDTVDEYNRGELNWL